MKEITLYKNLPSNTNIDNSLGKFTSTEIFTKGGIDEVWGNSDERCNPFSFSPLDASMDFREKSTKANPELEIMRIYKSLSISKLRSQKKTV